MSADERGLSQRAERKRSGNGGWISGEYGMLVFLRLVITFALLWAVAGSLLYGQLLDYLGWNWMSIELKWTIFVGLSLTAAAITAAFLVGAFQLFLAISRSFQSK